MKSCLKGIEYLIYLNYRLKMNHVETSGEHIVTFYCLALAMMLGLETSGDFPIYVIRMVAAPFLSLTS